MMIHPLKALRTYRRLRRYREVTFTLFRYGFDDIADRIGTSTFFWGWFRRKSKPQAETTPTEKRLRLVLSDLGPTFVKFGQLLSTRPDILPEKYIKELEQLQDQVPPFALQEVEKMSREDLDDSPTQKFQRFESEPLASGSIAQVHEAELPDGTRVAVKFRRPGIRKVIETDIEILSEITEMIERRVPELRWFKPRELVEQFARTIRRELDFVTEGQAMERFRHNFRDDPTRFVPQVYWDYSSERILTTDFVDGVKVNNLEEIEKRDLDRHEIAKNGARSILKEVFEFRLFHADPHPGNFFVLEDNVIAAIDYGIVGRLDDRTAEQLGRLLSSVINRDVEGIVEVFRDLEILKEETDASLLRFDIHEFLDRYYGLTLDRMDAEEVIQDLLRIVRQHQMVLPVNLALLGRMLMVSAGVGRSLDPKFDVIAEAKPFIRSFMTARLNPKNKLRDLGRTLHNYQRALSSFPRDFESIVEKVKKGEVSVSLHHKGLDKLILEMDRSSNRIAFALIVAALVVGSSLVMQLDRGPVIYGFPVIGLVGYLVAAICGLWLVIAILRSGRI